MKFLLDVNDHEELKRLDQQLTDAKKKKIDSFERLKQEAEDLDKAHSKFHRNTWNTIERYLVDNKFIDKDWDKDDDQVLTINNDGQLFIREQDADLSEIIKKAIMRS